MGVTGGRFPSPGRQCGAGGVWNRGSLAWRAAVAGHGVVASTGRVGARGDLRERQGSLVSAIQGVLEGGLGRAMTRGRPGGHAGVRTPSVGVVQGGER